MSRPINRSQFAIHYLLFAILLPPTLPHRIKTRERSCTSQGYARLSKKRSTLNDFRRFIRLFDDFVEDRLAGAQHPPRVGMTQLALLPKFNVGLQARHARRARRLGYGLERSKGLLKTIAAVYGHRCVYFPIGFSLIDSRRALSTV